MSWRAASRALSLPSRVLAELATCPTLTGSQVGALPLSAPLGSALGDTVSPMRPWGWLLPDKRAVSLLCMVAAGPPPSRELSKLRATLL